MTKASNKSSLQSSSGFMSAPEARFEHGGVILRAQFDRTAFSLNLFAALGVEMPGRVAGAVVKRQAEFLAGRSLAAQAQRALNVRVGQVHMDDNRLPIWPDGQAGSISHTRGHCACFLVTQEAGLPGIDIEMISSGNRHESICRKVLLTQERVLLEACDLELALSAIMVFSAKEAIYKALYPMVRRYFGFSSAELVAAPRSGILQFQLTETLHPNLPAGRIIPVRYEIASSTVMTWVLHRFD